MNKKEMSALKSLGVTPAALNAAMRKSLGTPLSNLPRRVAHSLCEKLDHIGARVIVVRGKGGVKVFSQDGHRKLQAGMMKARAFRKQETGVPK